MRNKKRFIVEIEGMPEIRLYSEVIARAFAELENGNILIILS